MEGCMMAEGGEHGAGRAGSGGPTCSTGYRGHLYGGVNTVLRKTFVLQQTPRGS